MATSAWLIARAAQQPPVLYLMVAVVSVRALGIGRGVLRYAERLISHDAAFRVLGGIRERLVAHLAVIAPAALPMWRRGDLLARTVDDVDDAGDAFLRGLLPLAGAALVGAGTIVLSFLILPAAGIALAVALVVACVLVPVLTARRSARIEGRAVQLRAGRTRLVTELLDDLPELTVSDGLAGRLDELDRIELASRRVAAGTARAAGLSAAIAVTAMGAAVWVAAWIGVPAVVSADLAPVLLAVLVLTPLALTDTVEAVGVAGDALHRASAALRRLFVVHGHPAGDRTTAGAPGSATGQGGWTDDPPARRLRSLARRESGCADRHRPGSGARTADSGGRRVRFGQVHPAGGAARVLDSDRRPDHRRRRRRRGPGPGSSCAACSPGATSGAHLFDSTVVENVRLARPGADDAEVEAALRDAGAGSWLDGLPLGMNTAVGEHGRAVSGGERQRVALARAILADRPVLLADEPAAHLDGATAESGDRPGSCDRIRAGASLLVTHRPQDEALADEVVRLADGRRVGRARPAAEPTADGSRR